MKKIASFFAGLINWIKKIAKFLASGIGMIPLFLIAVVMILILVYILVYVIGKSVAGMLGIDAPGADEYKTDAEFLQSLTNSGYDELIDAKQLMRYYSFEYSTLMDAARFLEEVGTTKIAKEDNATINPRSLSREQWLYLVAQAFGNGSSLEGGLKDVRAEQDAEGTAPEKEIPADENFSTECSENDLLYFRTYNEYTKQYCLMPYLCLTRVDDDLTFFFEVRNIAEEKLYKSKGKYNYQDTVDGSSSLGMEIAGKELRFNQMAVGGKGAGSIYEWLLAHVYPSTFNLLLNKANQAAFAEGDARYDGLTKSPVDLMMEYKEGNIYYTTDELEVPYKIPLRILLDRFLPNASLLSAWRHLSDDEVLKKKMGEGLGQNLVDELLKIYSEACLKDESMTSGGIVEEIISTSGDTKQKEIQVASSNNETFAKFETTLLKSTTFREWRFAIKDMGRMSNEDWFVIDALEELEANLDNITVTYDVVWVDNEDGKIREGPETHSRNFSPDELGGLIGVNYEDESTKLKIADKMVLDYTVTKENWVPKSPIGTAIRRHDTYNSDHTAHDYSNPPKEQASLDLGISRCDEESPNAMLDPKTAAAVGWHDTGTSTGAMYGEASDGTSYIELSMKSFGVAPGEAFNTDPTVELPEIDQKCNSSDALKDLLSKEEKERSYVVLNPDGTYKETRPLHPVITNIKAVHNMTIDYCVYMPTRVAVSMLSQRVIDKTLPNGYFVRDANYWAADKRYNNTYVICGEYLEEDREKFGFLVPNSTQGMGITDIRSDYKGPGYANWRCKLFAPIFAGLTENDLDSGREADVELVLSEWETVANNGVNAADHAMRDLYYLINYSKGILNEGVDVVKQSVSDDDFVANFKPLKQADGTTSLINVGSYTYLYLPDEIIMFDPLSCEKIFWLDRIVTTPDDRVDDDNENKMRSRLLTFTWQVVDYDLYEETEAESHGVDATDGKHYVYAMWPYGDQMSRLMYAIDSNANAVENEKYIKAWGGYSDVHKAADLYGRATAQKIYNSVYGEPKGQKEKVVFNEFYGYGYDRYTGGVSSITSLAEVSDDTTTSTTTTPTTTPDPGQKIEYDDVMLDSGADALYDEAPVTLLLGGTRYHFKGPAAAAFGYELYRQTVVEEDGKKAERLVKDQLEKELQWTEIRAQVPGIVTEIQSNARSGFSVTIKHSGYNELSANQEFTTSYAHMKRYPLVQEGQYVGAGTVIGYEGTTGYSLGYHLHTGYKFQGLEDADTPVRYLYPFFTPFFYEDQAKKAKDAAGNSGFLSSEYWSTVRTVFPYGQIVDSGLVQTLKANKDHNGLIGNPFAMAKDDEVTKTVDVETLGGENIVKIQNYTPQYPVLTDVKMLATSEDADDLSRINTTGNIMREAGKSEWDKDLLTTDPDYVDEGFIKQVEGNDNKIKGLK